MPISTVSERSTHQDDHACAPSETSHGPRLALLAKLVKFARDTNRNRFALVCNQVVFNLVIGRADVDSVGFIGYGRPGFVLNPVTLFAARGIKRFFFPEAAAGTLDEQVWHSLRAAGLWDNNVNRNGLFLFQ